MWVGLFEVLRSSKDDWEDRRGWDTKGLHLIELVGHPVPILRNDLHSVGGAEKTEMTR